MSDQENQLIREATGQNRDFMETEPEETNDSTETGDDLTNRPLAIKGLTSFRCRSQYGWIMIGATGRRDAMREARRSDNKAKRDTLQIWNGSQYIDA